MGVTRRALLWTGGAVAVGTPLLVSGMAGASVGSSKRFDLTASSNRLYWKKVLHETHHSMQGFAFDNVNRRLFVVQARNGGSGDDLCVNQVSFTGEVLGSMYLNNAGHGVSIGVEPVGSSSYIWMECDSSSNDANGRGTALARFKFANGKTPSVRKLRTGSKAITCATDPVNKRLLVRRIENGSFWYSLYKLSDAAAGNFSNRLVHFKQPDLNGSAAGTPVFQGYTLYGQYLYTLDGVVNTDNAYLTCIDMNTGKVKSRAHTEAGKSLLYREPEGMAVYRTTSGETRLFLGLASRPSAGSATRYSSLYYKNRLV